jgi:hypothetical protein
MSSEMGGRRAITLLIMALAASALACNAGGSQQATVQALGQTISGTATAAAAAGVDAGAMVQTAEAAATAQGSSLLATAQAAVGITEADQAATAAAAAPLLAELPNYGVDPSQGSLAWVHPPVTVQVTGYLQSDFENQFLGTVARDFVASTDITWNTTTGLSGCGFVFRSDGNQEAANQYLGLISRGGNGRAVFQAMVDGESKNTVDMYAYGMDPAFQWRNDTTNRLTIVARGNTFTFYTNGTQVGQVSAGDKPPSTYIPPAPTEPPSDAPQSAKDAYADALAEHQDLVDDIRSRAQAQASGAQGPVPLFDRGFVAMVAVSESGTTTCEFNNTWLWLFDQ